MRRTLQTHRKLAVWVALTAVLMCASFVLVAVALKQRIDEQRQFAAFQLRVDRAVCLKFNRFDTVVVASLQRSEKNLPKIAYFRSHPKELRAQLVEVRRQIRLFAPTRCR